MGLIDLADEELPTARATVEQAKAAAVTARKELDKHRQWLGQHQELYTEAVKRFERRLKRQALIAAWRTAWVPVELLTTALSRAALAYPRRRSLRAKLKDRIQDLDHPSELKFAQQIQERIQAMDR